MFSLPHIFRVWILCTIVLFFSSLCLFAQDDDPALINITTLEQLNVMRLDLNGDGVPASRVLSTYKAAFGTPGCAGSCTGYELMADLDFEDDASYASGSKNLAWIDPANGGTIGTKGWFPIGDISNPFTAVFEGNGHTISNLYINGTNTYVGLFGELGPRGKIRNLGIKGGSVTGDDQTGGLVGHNDFGTIIACYSTVTVEARGPYGDVGGLVGLNNNGSTIRASYTTGSVAGRGSIGGLVGKNLGTISACYARGNAEATGDRGKAGGLVGYNVGENLGTIIACYSTVTVEARGANSDVGGLVGYNDLGSIITCYATGNVEATGAYSKAGGLVGYNEGSWIRACYATGTAAATGSESKAGGLVGYNRNSKIWNSYFDYEAAGFVPTREFAQSTSALQTPSAYTGIYTAWNVDVDNADRDDDVKTGVDDPWDFGASNEYPVLRVDFDGDTNATVEEFGDQPRSIVSLPGTDVDGPVIDSFAPIRGAPGTIVTLTGRNFAAMAEGNMISFGGSALVAPSEASTLSLKVKVPAGAETGPIEVTVAGRTGRSNKDFAVISSDVLRFIFSVFGSGGSSYAYPNPTLGEVCVADLVVGREYVYRIYSLLGREVLRGHLSGSCSIGLTVLSSGQYVFVLEDEEDSEVFRTRLLMLE